MNGDITLDLTNISLNNLVVLILGIIALYTVVAIIAKKFHIAIFPFKVDSVLSEQQFQNVEDDLWEDIRNIDKRLKRVLKEKTRSKVGAIANLHIAENICLTARNTMRLTAQTILVDAVNENGFDEELLPDNFSLYHRYILDSVKDAYIDIWYQSKSNNCDMDFIEEWGNVEKEYTRIINEWFEMVMIEEKKACQKRLEKLESVIEKIKSSKYRAQRVQKYIDKNRKCIEAINSRLIKY